MRITKTQYYGIDILSVKEGYWLVSDTGDGEFSLHHPTTEEINRFRLTLSRR